jgi:HSP20 family protein
MDDLFSRFFGDSGLLSGDFSTTLPPLEWFTREGNLVVRADLPGIDPKDVDLSVEGDRLTIQGERKAVHEEDALHREVHYGKFARTIRLPGEIDNESINATYKDGVLEITMKAPAGVEAKKIPITVN